MKKLFLIFLIFSTPIFCENNFFKNITLRQSFQSKNDKAEPASFTFTNPKDGESSFLINTALGINLFPYNENLTFSPFIEYHRNTLIDKEQFTYSGGAFFEWVAIKITGKEIKWVPILIASAKYNNDRKKDIESFMGNIYVAILNPLSNINLGKVASLEFYPYFGIENENRMKTENQSDKGNIYRFFLRLNLVLNPFNNVKSMMGKIQISFDYQYRYDFSTFLKDLSKKHNYFTADLNYQLFQSNKLSAVVGLEYVNGEDPTQGFEKQSYYALLFKIKL